MIPAPKNNVAAGYKVPVKIELLKGAGLLEKVGLMFSSSSSLSLTKLATCSGAFFL